jgi:hypothetical protein
MFQSPVLKATLKLKDLPLLGPDLFWIGLGIDPEAPQLEPLLIELPPKLSGILVELLLLGLESLPLFRREIRIWVSIATSGVPMTLGAPWTMGKCPAADEYECQDYPDSGNRVLLAHDFSSFW